MDERRLTVTINIAASAEISRTLTASLYPYKFIILITDCWL